MAYSINGTDWTLQPTTGKWLPRALVGLDGNGRAIYEPLRSFEVTWQLSSPSEFDQILTWFDGIGSTGSYVVGLPQWSATTYAFYNYTGCFLQEPEMGAYFNQNLLQARMLITHIRG